MDVGRNETVFAVRLIDQVVYQGLSSPYDSSKMMVPVRCQLNYKSNKCNTTVIPCLGMILIVLIMLICYLNDLVHIQHN